MSAIIQIVLAVLATFHTGSGSIHYVNTHQQPAVKPIIWVNTLNNHNESRLFVISEMRVDKRILKISLASHLPEGSEFDLQVLKPSAPAQPLNFEAALVYTGSKASKGDDEGLVIRSFELNFSLESFCEPYQGKAHLIVNKIHKVQFSIPAP